MTRRTLPTRRLREHPDLNQLKRQAKELLEAFHGSCGGDAEIVGMALGRIDWPPGDERWFWMLGRSLDTDANGGSHLECFRQVLERSGPHAIGRFGRTMLHEVAAQRSPMNERGADPVEADAEPWATPRAWAEKMGYPEISQILPIHGGA